MGIVDEAVEDGVGEGRVTEAGVPVIDGHLGGDQGSAVAVAVVEDLQDITGLGGGEGITEPVVEDEQVDTTQGIQQLGVGAVGVGERGGVDQTGEALVAHGEAVATG